MIDALTAGGPPERFEARAMGSPLRLTVRGTAAGGDPGRWWRAVLDEFEAAEAAMSRFRDTSELTTMNTMNHEAIVTPSGRSMMLAIVV